MLQWPDIEPVLRKTYELMEGSGRTSGQAVMSALTLDDNDACSAFDALARGGFITVEQESARGIPFVIAPSQKGLERCAGWPSAEDATTFMAAFLEAVEAHAKDDSAPEPDRSRFAQLANALGAVGRDTLAEVAAKVITTGHLPV
jgi:hypothetical protein